MECEPLTHPCDKKWYANVLEIEQPSCGIALPMPYFEVDSSFYVFEGGKNLTLESVLQYPCGLGAILSVVYRPPGGI